MSFLVFAWGAAILYGLVNVTGKLTSKYAIKNVWLFNFLYCLFSLIFTIPLALGNHVGVPVAWGNLVMSAVFNVFFSVFYVLAIYNLDISVMGPLFNFRTAFGVILGTLVLKEVLNVPQAILIVIIFLAGMFVSIDEKFSIKSFFQKSVLYGVLMSLFLAISSIFINKSVAEAGYWETNLFNPLISQIFLLVTIPLFIKEIKKINLKKIGGVSLMALFLAVGNILANKAYAANVSISTAIEALPISMFIVFILAFVKPGLLEKHTLKVYIARFAAAFVMIGAGLTLSR